MLWFLRAIVFYCSKSVNLLKKYERKAFINVRKIDAKTPIIYIP